MCAAAEGGAPRLTTPPPRTPSPAAAPRPRAAAMDIGDAPRPLTIPPLDGVGRPLTDPLVMGDPLMAPRAATGDPRPTLGVGPGTPRPRDWVITPPRAPRTTMGDPRAPAGDPLPGDPRMLAGDPLVCVGVIGEGLGAILVGAGTVIGLPL